MTYNKKIPEEILNKLLPTVEKPARYTGNEYNIIIKEDATTRFALCFPDTYEIGMSHLGSRILYNVLNRCDNIACERAFAPWTDMEKVMLDNDIPLYSLETKRPLSEFDIIGFSLLYELCYSNILTMLQLSKIPFLSKDRINNNHLPLIVCGGPCLANPEPIADFFDCMLYGDGEELIVEFTKAYAEAKKMNLSKYDMLKLLSKISGVYVPMFYSPRYENNLFIGLDKIEVEAPDKIKRRIVKDLDKASYIGKPIVPNVEIVHDRIPLELFRGCTRGCRFCQAGFIYRPVRERSVKTLLKQARALCDCTGYDEVSLFSLSSGDYSGINELVTELMPELSKKHVSLALPSLRIDSLLKDSLEKIGSIRKTGLTFAPEAGTQRLRDVINKGVTEEDLLSSMADAFSSGWASVKLYFMLGLPTETDEDILGIAELAKKVSAEFFRIVREKREKGEKTDSKLRISISASTFVPKPNTPFQWVAQDDIETIQRKQELLKQALKGIRGVDFSYHASTVSTLESVFARGDRRMSNVIIKAHENGAKFDSWDDFFRPELWNEAFTELNYPTNEIAHTNYKTNKPLPWSHMDSVVTQAYLLSEYDKAIKGEITKDCRKGCNGCFGGGKDYENYCKL